MKTIGLNEYGQVEDFTIAESMANIEKPFRETPVTGFKKLFTSKTKQIIKGEKLAEEYFDNIVNSSTYKQKLKEKEEKEIKEEQDRQAKEMEEKWAKENPEDINKLLKYKEYLDTIPSINEALDIVKKFAIKANEERSNDSYIAYKKSRRLFYEYFLKNKFSLSKNMEQILLMPSDWYSTKDDEYFLEELRKYDDGELYGGYGYISIYRIGNKFLLHSGSGIINKSLAIRLIIDYANHSGYTNMTESGTKGFILATLSMDLLLSGKKDYGLMSCTPLYELQNTNKVFDKQSGSMYHNLINDLIKAQNDNLRMNKKEYQEYQRKQTIKLFQEIYKQQEENNKQEELRKKETEKREKEKEEQKKMEEERLNKQKALKETLINI